MPNAPCCGSGRRCAAALRHVRAVTATYRMTTRPPPSRPSHYAAGVLAPLRAFLDAAHGRALPAATRARLAQARPVRQLPSRSVCAWQTHCHLPNKNKQRGCEAAVYVHEHRLGTCSRGCLTLLLYCNALVTSAVIRQPQSMGMLDDKPESLGL